jgi:glycosyltransferase involved in cell wall biosynthesis
MSLGGFLCIRNGLKLDYCFQEAIQSMLPICDQVVVSESDSDDGTRALLDEWAKREPKLKIISYPWTDPKGDQMWWPTWLNDARTHLETDYAIYLDADEVFHEDSYGFIRQSAMNGEALMCQRYNFWRDAWHLIPHGHCCGFEVIRCGPRGLWFPTDYPDPNSGEIEKLARKSTVQIMHYGFLRERKKFFLKAREVLRIWANAYDPRLEAVEGVAGNWMEEVKDIPWTKDLVPFTGTHPKIGHQWLLDRGHQPISTAAVAA